jgi:hypothetical protein
MRNISAKSFREQQDTHFTLNNFPSKNPPFFRYVKNYCSAGQDADDNITPHMRIGCRIFKTTNTHTEYVILIALPL